LLLILQEGFQTPFTLSFAGYHLEVAIIEEESDKQHFIYFLKWKLPPLEGTALAQWLRCYATNRKVTGSIPAVSVDFSLT